MRLRKPKTRRRVVAAISDTHGGYRLGLCDPNVVLLKEDDKGREYEWTPELTTTQLRLWDVYLDNLADLAEFVGNDPVVGIHGGDVTQGDRFNAQIPEITREDQREIAKVNLLPMVRLPTLDKYRLVTGTEVHVPEAAEVRVARMLRNETGKDVRSLHHGRLSFDGVVFDVAHHGPYPGSRDWLRGNVALYYLRDRIYQDRREGVDPATVYLRGHFHEHIDVPFTDTWRGVKRTHRVIVVPSYSGLTHYARKVTRSTPVLTTGMVAFEIIDGKLGEIREFMQRWDLRVEEEL